jgi:hypothetical protein
MHLTLDEYRRATEQSTDNLKMDRRRGISCCAFGRAETYAGLSFVRVDCAAHRMRNALSTQMAQAEAALVVLDGWPIWMRAAALAEDSDALVFLYVLTGIDPHGKKARLLVGSHLDGRDITAMQIVAADIQRKTGISVREYTGIEMKTVLAETRAIAARAGFDFSQRFLPAFDDPRLEQLLKDAGDDGRAVVVGRGHHARKVGAKARVLVEGLH